MLLMISLSFLFLWLILSCIFSFSRLLKCLQAMFDAGEDPFAVGHVRVCPASGVAARLKRLRNTVRRRNQFLGVLHQTVGLDQVLIDGLGLVLYAVYYIRYSMY